MWTSKAFAQSLKPTSALSRVEHGSFFNYSSCKSTDTLPTKKGKYLHFVNLKAKKRKTRSLLGHENESGNPRPIVRLRKMWITCLCAAHHKITACLQRQQCTSLAPLSATCYSPSLNPRAISRGMTSSQWSPAASVASTPHCFSSALTQRSAFGALPSAGGSNTSRFDGLIPLTDTVQANAREVEHA